MFTKFFFNWQKRVVRIRMYQNDFIEINNYESFNFLLKYNEYEMKI